MNYNIEKDITVLTSINHGTSLKQNTASKLIANIRKRTSCMTNQDIVTNDKNLYEAPYTKSQSFWYVADIHIKPINDKT